MSSKILYNTYLKYLFINTFFSLYFFQVSEKYGLINLVVGAQTDGIFKSNNTKVFTSVTPNALVAPTVLQVCGITTTNKILRKY